MLYVCLIYIINLSIRNALELKFLLKVTCVLCSDSSYVSFLSDEDTLI